MRITFEYGLVGDPAGHVRTLTTRRPTIYAAEDEFEIGMIGEFAKGEVSAKLLDWVLWHAHTDAVKNGGQDGDAVTWDDFVNGDVDGSLDWSEPAEVTTGNPRSAGK